MPSLADLTLAQRAALRKLVAKTGKLEATHVAKPFDVQRGTMDKLARAGLVERRVRGGYPTYGVTDAGMEALG